MSFTHKNIVDTLVIVDGIHCIGANCPKECDWLGYIPTAPALWTLGGVAIAAALFIPFKSRRLVPLACELIKDRLAALSLGLGMVLRASLALDDVNKISAYSACQFFNYFGSLCVFYTLFCNARNIKTKFGRLENGKLRYATLFIGGFFALLMLVLLILGVSFMFHRPGKHDSVVAGMRCIQTMLAMMLVFTLAMAAAFLLRLKQHLKPRMTKPIIASTALVFALLLLWTSFMFARTFVGLDSVARKSEVMFFMLNILPQILLSLTTFTLGEPLTGSAPDAATDKEKEANANVSAAATVEAGGAAAQ
ncbi:hypothetical protein IWW48_005579 [Coemansia sp. RSA 1200]|nr:hypothetical protein IWW48_005579 [Coemansia sp. RSA 1200]